MSTFKGKLKEDEFQGVIIDYFDKNVLREGQVFFLSHFHTDHMKAIEYLDHELETNRNKRFYCSDITKGFLVRSRRVWQCYIHVLTPQNEEWIEIDGRRICVSSIPAGHCPGSLMFLFTCNNVRALYTGDFRVSLEDLRRFKPLHDSLGNPLPLHSIYLDTTFVDRLDLPTRKESTSLLLDTLAEWFAKGPEYKAIIHPSANTGTEHLFSELIERFKKKIHVTERGIEKFYFFLEDCHNFFTLNSAEADVHFCLGKSMNCRRNCEVQSFNVKSTLEVNLVALFFGNENILNGPIQWSGRGSVRICYSTHSSLTEIIDFLIYLKPLKIYPSVVYPNGEFTTEEQIVNHLKAHMDLRKSRRPIPMAEDHEEEGGLHPVIEVGSDEPSELFKEWRL